MDNKLHPCAFLFRKLSLAERNYDVGSRKLLTVKVALEMRRHWGQVWSGQIKKNLEYIKSLTALTLILMLCLARPLRLPILSAPFFIRAIA